MNAAATYITHHLRFNPTSYQIHETWEKGERHFAVLAQFDDAGHELQLLIEVWPDGVRWIPLRIFRSGGRDAQTRGICLWFNPAEVEEDAMSAHNRAVLALGVG